MYGELPGWNFVEQPSVLVEFVSIEMQFVGVSIEVANESLARFLGRRLREIRIAKGLSQRELETLGINPKYYQRIEAGRVNLTLKSLEKLAAALGVGVLEFFQVSEGSGKKRI